MGLPKRDHPRLRGEYGSKFTDMILDEGSPPLTRGIPETTFKIMDGQRITPAYAGNTAVGLPVTSSGVDHPRLRGEYLHPTLHPNGAMGSPPLTRGIPHPLRLWAYRRGITPAYAGNTLDMICE